MIYNKQRRIARRVDVIHNLIHRIFIAQRPSQAPWQVDCNISQAYSKTKSLVSQATLFQHVLKRSQTTTDNLIPSLLRGLS